MIKHLSTRQGILLPTLQNHSKLPKEGHFGVRHDDSNFLFDTCFLRDTWDTHDGRFCGEEAYFFFVPVLLLLSIIY
jgi:hypothetical protein